jgi:hypothetical protein
MFSAYIFQVAVLLLYSYIYPSHRPALACAAALRGKESLHETYALPFLLVLPENEKSDWRFKMPKNMAIYAKIIIDLSLIAEQIINTACG